MKAWGKTQKKDVTDPLSEEQVYRGGMKVLRVSPGSQSPHRSQGFPVQMKAPLIRAKKKDRKVNEKLKYRKSTSTTFIEFSEQLC